MFKQSSAISMIIITIYSLAAVEANVSNPAPYPSISHFVGDAGPGQCEATGNPLDYAGARIGLDVRNVELPRGHEGRYRFACRFPIIDYVSNSPLFMKQWAEDTAESFTSVHNEGGIKSVRYALQILRGITNQSELKQGADSPACQDFSNQLKDSAFSGEYREILMVLYRHYFTAIDLIRESRGNLTNDDLEFFENNPGYFLAPDGATMPSLTGNVDTHFEFIGHARRVKYEYIFLAAEYLADAVREYTQATKTFGKKDYFLENAGSATVFRATVADVKVVIAGFGNDHHDNDADLLIDLGGNDVYANNAGGCSVLSTGAALAIDHGGDDEYSASSRNYVQGFGFLGAGFLVDLEGDDTYSALHFSQGAGIAGVGVLWDTDGDDSYSAHAFCQGAGMFGLGILLDSAGEDFYDCATIGQGAATTLGLGILSDLKGDDRYHLAVGSGKNTLGNLAGYGQGGALSFRHYPWKTKLTAYGGAGMLVDASGNDRYRTNGWCDQGGSYIMSLGALVDFDGNDHYSANTGQGSGIHITNAILIDKNGHDIYEGGFRSGGSGGDRSPGFLIDYHGNDKYMSRTSSYGTGCKPFSFSLFIDYEGDDTYKCDEPETNITFNNWDSFGGVWPESVSYLWPYAICLDLNGNDNYQVRNHENNSERHSFGHGIHIDMSWNGGDVIGMVKNPLEPYFRFELPKQVKKSPYHTDIQSLQNPDTFIRFQATGRIVQGGPGVLPALVDAVKDSTHKQFNRDIMECIHYLLVNNQITDTEIPYLQKLLLAKDNEIRMLMADNLGIWKLTSAEKSLINCLQDNYDDVRRYALQSLYTLESEDALPRVKYLAERDPSPDVRRFAVKYLAKFDRNSDTFRILAEALQNDPDVPVRVEAAENLALLNMPDAVPLLRNAAQSYDMYIRRAAAKALAEYNQVEGIGLLIDSLSFPSIDAFYNYNRNVPNMISGFAGYDLPEPARYSQEEWRIWFETNRDSIRIRENAEAYRMFEEMTENISEKPDAEQISIYENFLDRYSFFPLARKNLANLLNGIAWDMVTAPRNTERFDPETGLKYALRAVELDPSINIIDTLAEAYIADGNLDEAENLCHETLLKHPGEKMFQDKLQRIKQLREIK